MEGREVVIGVSGKELLLPDLVGCLVVVWLTGKLWKVGCIETGIKWVGEGVNKIRIKLPPE